MASSTRRRGGAALMITVGLVMGACSADRAEDVAPSPGPAPGAEQPTGSENPPADAIPVFGAGVTKEPCAQPAGGVANADNGCITLGTLTDLTEGQFAPFAVLVQRGQYDFWARVNADGGIGGFDIDIDSYTRDTVHDPEEHLRAYLEIEPHILLLAQSFGTPTTQRILDAMDVDDVVAVPAAWWSGFDFSETSRGLLLPSGPSYCLSSMIGLDWFSEMVRPIAGVAVVGYVGAFGGDVAEGARLWAGANDVRFLDLILTGRSGTQVADQEAAIRSLVATGADVVVLGVGPQDAAAIVGGVADLAAPGSIRFIGPAPFWDSSVLQTTAAPALIGLYTNVAPWEDVEGGSFGHAAMREAFGDTLPINQGYAAGWVWQYPIKALLEAAVASGDLTRANLRALVDGLVVDYEGVLPVRRMGDDPKADVVPSAVIGAVSTESANGLETIVAGYRGPTADAFAYTAACSGN